MDDYNRQGGDLEEGGRTCQEEQAVDDLLIVERQSGEFTGQREDHMVVSDREEFVLSGGEPLITPVRQTLRAMPVPTGVERDGAPPARGTTIEMSAQRRHPAARDGAEHASVLRRQPGAVSFD